MAKTPVVSAGSTVSVTGGKSQQVPLGQGISNATYLDPTLQDDDVSSLFDGKINFQGTDYDSSEELQLCDVSGQKYGEPYVATSLMLPDDDFKSNVYLIMGKDKIKYAYKFDKSINVSLATTSNPLEIDFLGKRLKITAVTAGGAGFTGGNGGNIIYTNNIINLTGALINITGGTGTTAGTAGRLTLNYTNSFDDTNSRYGNKIKIKIIKKSRGMIDWSANETTSSSLTNISQNMIMMNLIGFI